MTRSLPALLALLLGACSLGSTAPAPEEQASSPGHGHRHDGHGHGHDDHDHGHGHDGHAPDDVPQGRLGPYQVSLTPSGEDLQATLTDASGAVVTPVDELRLVLTGAGQDAQRIVLSRQDQAYRGAASASGAEGYVAVLSATLDGETESVRITWGQVATPHGHEHDAGHPHGGSEDHGHEH